MRDETVLVDRESVTAIHITGKGYDVIIRFRLEGTARRCAEGDDGLALYNFAHYSGVARNGIAVDALHDHMSDAWHFKIEVQTARDGVDCVFFHLAYPLFGWNGKQNAVRLYHWGFLRLLRIESHRIRHGAIRLIHIAISWVELSHIAPPLTIA